MHSAAQQAGSDGPDTAADLAATLGQLRRAMRRPGNSDATARALTAAALALADIGVTMLEHRSALERNTAARGIADEQVLIGREIERGDAWSGLEPLSRARATRPLRLVLPG